MATDYTRLVPDILACIVKATGSNGGIDGLDIVNYLIYFSTFRIFHYINVTLFRNGEINI